MIEKFQNKYRIQSARLPHWDYAWPAAYFVTICTQNRECFFGNIVNGNMHLSPIGKLADTCWQEIPSHTRNVKLDAFVVMPNHVHGIIILHENNDNQNVETLHATSLPKKAQMADISPKPGSLSTIIRSYKSAVTKYAHRLGDDFAWQPRFYDHIIRNQKSKQQIETYILNNPANWHRDKLYTKEPRA